MHSFEHDKKQPNTVLDCFFDRFYKGCSLRIPNMPYFLRFEPALAGGCFAMIFLRPLRNEGL